MSRSGYTDDCEYIHLYRNAVERALFGTRGQRFLRELIAALEAMPEKRLISQELEIKDGTPGWLRGGVCALGCLGKARGLDMSTLDPHDHDTLGSIFNVAPSLIAEVEYENDGEWLGYKSDEERYEAMLAWARGYLVTAPAPAGREGDDAE